MIRRVAPRYCIASSGRRVRVAFDLDVTPGHAPEIADALRAALASPEVAEQLAKLAARAQREAAPKGGAAT